MSKKLYPKSLDDQKYDEETEKLEIALQKVSDHEKVKFRWWRNAKLIARKVIERQAGHICDNVGSETIEDIRLMKMIKSLAKSPVEYQTN